jgi:hypothetical protein
MMQGVMMKAGTINRDAQIFDNLRRIPRKILQLHNHDNIAHFVLHELCSKNCFDIPKAAYFIDNPDFNCFKGIAGICQKETSHIKNPLDNPNHCDDEIIKSPFNQKVREFNYESRKNRGHSHEEMAEIIAKTLDMKDYGFYFWDMKHDNHGLLVCEKNNQDTMEHLSNEIVVDGLCLLGFCHIY